LGAAGGNSPSSSLIDSGVERLRQRGLTEELFSDEELRRMLTASGGDVGAAIKLKVAELKGKNEYERINSMGNFDVTLSNMGTDGPTNHQTNRPTDKVFYRNSIWESYLYYT
jgi:hypothetical protein